LPQNAGSLDPAAVHFHEPLHQGQADSQSALRAVQGTLGLREQIEDAGQDFGSDPHARITRVGPGLGVEHAVRT